MNPPPHLAGSRPQGSWAGKLLLRTIYQPWGNLSTMLAAGPTAYYGERWGENAMRKAAPRLPPDPRPVAEGYRAPAVFLTGERYWHESLFCAHSLQRTLDQPVPLRFISDGSLTAARIALIRAQFPAAEFIDTTAMDAVIERTFPTKDFPMIRYYRQQKPIIRKLTDVFAAFSGPQLLLDSDMLFFTPPSELLAWMKNPQGYLAMRDIKNAYGYSSALMERLCGAPLPRELNIGIYGMAGADLDWPEIESWIRTLTETEGLQYNLCQGLSAMLYARIPHLIVPMERYRLLPDRAETRHPTAVMHHYVAESKQWYRRYAWRRIHP